MHWLVKLRQWWAGKPTTPVSRNLRSRYDAAQTNHTNQRWWLGADSLSALTANSPTVRKTLRNRSRYEFANNSYCNGIVQTLANDLIGTGPRLQMLIDDSQANQVLEAAFETWANEVRLPEKLRTLRTAEVVDGEAFLMLTTNLRLANPVKLDLRTVEADQIASPGLWQETERAVDGIEFDEYGNPARYHLLESHPGTGSSQQSKPVPAEAMIHTFRADRPGQVRGIPQYTAALDLFAELRRFTRATVLAAETAASFPLVIQTNSPAVDPAEVSALDVITLENGEATTMPKGWTLGQMRAEHPSTSYGDFKREILNEIARCLSVPLNVGAGETDFLFTTANILYLKFMGILHHSFGRRCGRWNFVLRSSMPRDSPSADDKWCLA